MWSTAKPFINGGLSGMAATCIIQPIDMVKVRIQIGAQGTPVSLAGVWAIELSRQTSRASTTAAASSRQLCCFQLPLTGGG